MSTIRLKRSNRAAKMMAGNSKFIALAVILILTLVFYILYMREQNNSTYTNIQYIKSFMSSSGNLNDYSNKLGMHNPETDIEFFYENKEVRIEFGRITLTWPIKDFMNEDNLTQLQTIGITHEVKNGRLIIYYQGLEIERRKNN